MIDFNRQGLLVLSTVLMVSFPSSVLAQTKHPAEEAGIKSTPGSPATSTFVRFVNQTQEQIKVYWLDLKGKRVLYLTLNPGQDGGISTYLTHPWLIADSQGNAKDIFFPDSRGRKIEIRSKTISATAAIDQLFRTDTPLAGATIEEHQNLMKAKAEVLQWLGSYRGVRQENDRSVINFERGSVPVKVVFGEDGNVLSITAGDCPTTSVPIGQAPSQYRKALAECPNLKP
jgi:von Hippel-Lindau disease tumor supressor